MNYKKLLEKYMMFVRDSEGIDYVTPIAGFGDIKFTEEEWAELVRISEGQQK